MEAVLGQGKQQASRETKRGHENLGIPTAAAESGPLSRGPFPVTSAGLGHCWCFPIFVHSSPARKAFRRAYFRGLFGGRRQTTGMIMNPFQEHKSHYY